MDIKSIVDEILIEKNRTFTWLAEEMNKTFDGLKLSLTRESIKYKDLIAMSKALEVHPTTFFDKDSSYSAANKNRETTDAKSEYSDLKNNLKNCREMMATLKEQIKDKDKIISLLSKD